MKSTFSQKVVDTFDFLINEYGFSLITKNNSERWPEGEGFISYISAFTYVLIDGENGGVGVGIARVKDHEDNNPSREGYHHVISSQIVYEYNLLTNNEKNIILSLCITL